MAPAPARGPLRVDLVSPAFVVQQYEQQDNADACSSTRILERCSGQLGIATEELSLFELRPLRNGPVDPGCTHVGVAVRGSGESSGGLGCSRG